jgi:putative Holliday junction resolvase
LSETVLGFDVGARRIGVAVGNDLLRQARAAAIVQVGEDEGLNAIAKIVDAWRPERLVVGMPLPLSPDVDADVDAAVGAPAKASPALIRSERFATRLGQRFNLPVERVDERYSSIDADHLHRDRRQAGLARRAKALDDVAAEVILQRYFDALPPPAANTP